MKPHISKPYLEKLYEHQRLSLRQIAKLEGVSYSKIYRLLKRYEITLRSADEGRLLRRGRQYRSSSHVDIDEDYTDEHWEALVECLQRQKARSGKQIGYY